MDLHALLGDDADGLLNHTSKGIAKEDLHLPGPGLPRPCLVPTDRSPAVLRNLGRSTATAGWPAPGYLSILPVDQGIEHSAAASFAPNPLYFDPANICRLAVEGGCNAVATDVRRARRGQPPVRPQDPLHREAQPQRAAHLPEQVRPDHVRLGEARRATSARPASAPPSTSARTSRPARSRRSPTAFEEAHELGMFTVLWCYLRNSAFKTDGSTTTSSADLTGQANHLGVTIEADIIKQKLPENNGGYNAFSGYGKTSKLVYDELTTDHPIDLCRWQVANCYMGRIGLINSRRRVQGRRRHGGRRAHRRDQQAGRWAGADLGPQGLPAADGRGHRAAARHPGRLPGRRRSPSPDTSTGGLTDSGSCGR